MTMPPDGRPDQSVNPGGDFELAAAFQTLVTKVEALTSVIQSQTNVQERSANAQARYAAISATKQAQISDLAVQRIQVAGGLSPGMTGGTSQITPTGALSSLQNLQSFTAQRIGQWMAGTPLFTGGSGGTGLTPIGTPNSTTAPAGSGAQAVQRASAPSGGGTGGPGGPGQIPGQAPGPGLGGLPGKVFGAAGPASQGESNALGYMQLAGSRIAMSGGTLGGIAGAIKGLPGIGLAVDAYTGLTNFYQGQYEQGRQYQETEGGTNEGGQAERLHQAGYQLSMAFSPLGSKAAGQAFNAVTALGYSRASTSMDTTFGGTGAYAQDRMGALNFAYNQFTSTGAPIDQSVQMIQAAGQNVTISLKQVGEALLGISDDAGKAGANANTARQQFLGYFQTAIQGGAGQGSPALAGAVAATQASYGKQFAGTSFAGELTQQRQYLISGQTGLSIGQLQTMQRTNPNQYAGLIGTQNVAFLTYLGIQPDAMQALQQMIGSAGGGAAVKMSPDLADRIANQWLNQYQGKYDWNLTIWAQILSSLTGISLTPANVGAWIVQQVAGNNEASGANHPVSGAPGGGTSGTPTSNAAGSGAATGQYGLAQGVAPAPITGPMSRFGGMTSGQSWQQVLTGKSGTAATAYLSEEKTAGQRSPVLEALLQNLSQGDQVQVQTKNGPRVMSFTDAMKYYPDELMSGAAQFFSSGGKSLGNTSSITHGLTYSDPTGVAAEEKAAAGSNLGVTSKAWQRSHPGSTVKSGGVTISLAADAQKLLKLLPGNGEQAGAAGTAPTSPWPTYSSR
jgi:hypothetical protein